MRRFLKWTLAMLVFAALLGAGAYLLFTSTRTTPGAAPVAEPTPVTAVRLAPGSFELRSEYSARLEAARDVVVAAKVGGTVEEDLIREGDVVEEGQVLYRIDDDSPRYAADQAAAALDAAREALRKTSNISRPELLRRLEAQAEQSAAALAQAESDAARSAALHEAGAIPLSQKERTDLALAAARSQEKVARGHLEEARAGARDEDRAAAEAAVRQAEAALLLAREQLENTAVTSPLSGTVASKRVFAGDTVAPGTPLAEIVDLSHFKITLGVSQADVAVMKRGDVLTVRPAFSPARLAARVVDVGVKADERTGSFPVILRMENEAGGGPPLRAGMDVTLSFSRRRIDGAIVVPAEALLRRQGGFSAFVVEDGVARRREPVVGPSSEAEAVISAGLAEGELLVVVGQQRLRDGDPVEISIEE